ncbi:MULTISPECIES: MarR family winged helix-turn-helix transcriptional regulator [Luteimonas]|uniref:MarR family winged helix-turn-helix transcriptional regulator n=1 Tax=Luteimonas TaxID=83614 RepID=UPI000C7A4ED3|nr:MULTISPECIES: MarR family winged helix-turn-helix transcriptional regulator [Luteimonas]
MPDARPASRVIPVSACSCQRLRKLSRLMSQRYDQALAPAGLNVNQYAILRYAQRQARTVGELAATLGMQRSTLSRDLKHLVTAGWLQLQRDPDDARQRRVALLPAGSAILTDAEPRWRDAQRQVEALLGVDEVGQLHATLDRVTAKLLP